MDFSQDSLRQLAARLRDGDLLDPDHFEHELARRLLPLIRCAIRSGAGQPRLVRWVRRHLPPHGDLEAAPGMARLLSARLVQQFQAGAPSQRLALDTVCGR
jgi:hypothetical protein